MNKRSCCHELFILLELLIDSSEVYLQKEAFPNLNVYKFKIVSIESLCALDMSHNGPQRGARFALSMLGCCKGVLKHREPKKCTERLSAASNAVCSCLEESEGSSLSSFCYMPLSACSARPVPYINRYPKLVIPPEERFVVRHYAIRSHKQNQKKDQSRPTDLNANINVEIIDKDKKEVPCYDSDSNDSSSDVKPTNGFNLRKLQFQQYQGTSVESVRARVLKEHAGWKTDMLSRYGDEDLEVEMPNILRQTIDSEDYDEEYDRWEESRFVALKRLAGQRE